MKSWIPTIMNVANRCWGVWWNAEKPDGKIFSCYWNKINSCNCIRSVQLVLFGQTCAFYNDIWFIDNVDIYSYRNYLGQFSWSDFITVECWGSGVDQIRWWFCCDRRRWQQCSYSDKNYTVSRQANLFYFGRNWRRWRITSGSTQEQQGSKYFFRILMV